MAATPAAAEFTTTLQRLMEQRRIGNNALAAAVVCDKSTVSKIVSGERKPSSELVAALDDALDAGGALIAAAERATLFARTQDSASTSTRLARWVNADRVAEMEIDALQFNLGRIAADYVHTPLQPLFTDLERVRDDAGALLKEHPKPDQARELLFLSGTSVLLLAHASQNLGDGRAAMSQAMAAEELARTAGHPGLLAWAAGTKALIAEWSRQPLRALRWAEEGMAIAPSGEQRVRLAALTARCAARAGRAEDARAALRAAAVAAEEPAAADEVTELGGILRFPQVKAIYYAGSTLALLQDWDAAAEQASTAIRIYTTGPDEERSYGDEALARVDLALAHLGHGEIDGAADALEPVFALAPAQRIRQIGDGLIRVRQALVRAGTRADTSLTLLERIDAFDTIDREKER